MSENMDSACYVRFVPGEIPEILSVSASMSLLGYLPETILNGGIRLLDLIHPDDHDIAHNLCARELPPPGSFTIRIRHANGRIICCRGECRLASTGETSGEREICLQDARRLASDTDAEHTMLNFRAMMESSDDFIYFKDRNHVFTGASQTLVSITHSTQHWTDLIGQTDYDVFPEHLADAYFRLEKQVFSGKPQRFGYGVFLDVHVKSVEQQSHILAADPFDQINPLFYGIDQVCFKTIERLDRKADTA